MIQPESGRPDDRVELGRIAVGERHRPTARARPLRADPNPVSTRELLRTVADDLIPPGESLAQPRVHRHAGGETQPGCPPPDVPPERPLRDRRELLSERELDGVGGRELPGDLTSGVRAT